MDGGQGEAEKELREMAMAKDRFPEDFMFQMTMQEANAWWSEVMQVRLRSQNVTLKRGQHIKYRPYAFTEHGILMLSSILNSSHPETPSPLAGEGRGEGELKRKSEIPNRYHPHPSLLHRRGRGKFGFPDEN